MATLGINHIRHAHEVLSRVLPPSPLLSARPGTHNGELWVKCESLQPTGSFKIRGATYRMSQLSARERAAGVVAYSTGNHAQAVAKAAADAGVTSTIVMSKNVPEAKVRATEGWGAKVLMAGPTTNERRALAEQLAHETGATLIPPFNDLDIIAGQGTIAWELAVQLGELSRCTIFVPIGGGGLIAGIAVAAKALAPSCRVIGVEPEWENDAARSFKTGHIVTAAGPSDSIADAIKVEALGELTFPLIRAFVDDIITVSEEEIARATLDLFYQSHLVVEPAGAVGFAAARRQTAAGGEQRVAILCGGNITLERLYALTTLGGATDRTSSQNHA